MHYASLPQDDASWTMALLQADGIAPDDVLGAADSFAAMVTGTTREANYSGYSRQTVRGLTVVADDELIQVDFNDLWFPPATGPVWNTIAKAVLLYDSHPAASSDVDRVPVVILPVNRSMHGEELGFLMPPSGLRVES